MEFPAYLDWFLYAVIAGFAFRLGDWTFGILVLYLTAPKERK